MTEEFVASNPPGAPRQFSRRAALGSLGGFLALVACSTATSASAQGRVTTAQATATKPYTIDQLLAKKPFFIAHRGSGDNWVEHTMDSYKNAVAAGAIAIEVSVHATKDGVLVCHHDQNAKRMTGVDREIKDMTWDEVSRLRNDARRWLGPSAATQPIPKLTDVLDAFIDNYVIFLEDKSGVNPEQVLNAATAHPNAQERVVWKQHVGAPNLEAAKRRGFKTWGYFTNRELHLVDQYKDRFDLLGLNFESDDDGFRKVVGTGKPVICWEVHRRSDRERLKRLGVRGLMCSNYPHVARRTSPAKKDAFGTGLRAAGDLPQQIGGDWAMQPRLLAGEAVCRMDQSKPATYCLGSIRLRGGDPYTLRWSMRWPQNVAASGDHAGIAFGQNSDAPYRAQAPSAAPGYHVVMRGNGSITLFEREAGQSGGTEITGFSSTAPRSGEWVTMSVRVSGSTMTVIREGDSKWSRTATNDRYRGDFISVFKNTSNETVDFRAITVEQ